MRVWRILLSYHLDHPNKSGDDIDDDVFVMPRNSKPWLNYTSDAPVREYHKTPKTKRHFKWALFWLIVGGYWGAHRLYLWDFKKAGLILLFYIFCSLISLTVLAGMTELGEDVLTTIGFTVSWLLIIIFELPRLKRRVDFKNKKHLLN